MRRLQTISVLWLLFAHGVSAGPSVRDLVEAMIQYHPEFRATLQRTEQVAVTRTEADAAFDLRVVQDTYIRPSGFYDGVFANQQVVQPIASMNAEVFGSYRVSDGNFPTYESELETLDNGEASLGVKLSLLQNREIDARRLKVRQADQKLEEAEAQQSLELNKLIFSGVSAYLEWHRSSLRLGVIRDLVRVTRDRLEGIRARVDSGDLARISLTEFQSTLLAREILQREAEQRFALARQRLTYFWRGQDEGMSSVAEITAPPADIGWPYTVSASPAEIDNWLSLHPGLEALGAQVRQAENDQSLAKNETLPQLDLEMKVARDLGTGIEPLTGTESIVGVSFSVPIGQRAARAREAIASARIRELEYETLVLEDQLRRDVDLALKALDFSQQIQSISREQEAVAEALQDQEQTRFEAGVSDLFLLIQRETAALQAHLRRVDADIDVLRQELTVHATLAVLDQPI